MLKEQLVEVTVSNREYDYYSNLGYSIQKEKNDRGKMVVPKNTKLIVDVNHVTKGSHANIILICDNCGKEYNSTYCDYTRKTTNVDLCEKCNNANIRSKIKNEKYLAKDGKKLCKSCNRLLPANYIHFGKNKTNIDGFNYKCKECSGRTFKIKKEIIKKNINNSYIEFKFVMSVKKNILRLLNFFIKINTQVMD